MESVEQDGEQSNRDELILQQQREIEREVSAPLESSFTFWDDSSLLCQTIL